MPNYLITGANSGIGFVAAQKLLNLGNNVVIMCRSKERGEAALKELEITAKNAGKDVKLILCDLSRQTSVKQACQEFRNLGMQLDCLILNAGVMETKLQLTEDGVETTIATNHLGHMLMTELLLDLIPKGGRIVVVSSLLHKKDARGGPKLELDNFDAHKGKYDGMTQYRTTKLLNVLFTKQLASQLKEKDITVNCLSPGWIPQTGLGRNAGWFTTLMVKVVSSFMSKDVVRTIDQGADVIVNLSTDPSLANVTGEYFDCDSKIHDAAPETKDEGLQIEAWNVSCDFLKMPEKKLSFVK